jgi:hypothetical protein
MRPAAAIPRGESSGRPGARRRVGPAGDSWGLLSVLVEPRLQQNGRGHAVDELAPTARRNAALAQTSRRFDRRQTLIDELHLFARGIGEGLGKTARAAGFAPFFAASIERQTDEKAIDLFGLRKLNELGDDPPR